MTENCFKNELEPEKYAAVEENYKVITEAIAEAAVRSGRKPEEITFLAATKTVEPALINHAISLGLKAIGENRVQELLDKYESLNLTSCDLQFIGRLQTNKIKYLVGKVSQIQSIDSVGQAKELSRLCVKAGTTMKVLVEVNVGREEKKGGILPEALYEFIDEIRRYPAITVNGLMAIPPICDDEKQLRQYFSSMRQYYVDIGAKKLDNVSMSCLSMGMSSDYREAIECGATMVRIGSSLFGSRIYLK